MEYKRLKNQLRIHWWWIKNNEDFEEVYEILKIWIDTDTKKKNSNNELVSKKECQKCSHNYGEASTREIYCLPNNNKSIGVRSLRKHENNEI